MIGWMLLCVGDGSSDPGGGGGGGGSMTWRQRLMRACAWRRCAFLFRKQ